MKIRVALRAAAILVPLGVFGLALAGCSDPAEKLKSADPAVCIEGLRQLARRESDEAVDRILGAANHPDEMVAVEAVRTLGDMRNPKATAAIGQVASQNKRAAVRQEAVIQLGRREGPEALVVLRKVVQVDPDPRVRGGALTAIVRQRSLGDVPLLVRVAESDGDLLVQTQAVGAVERLVGIRYRFNPSAPPEARQRVLEAVRLSAERAAVELEKRRREAEAKKK